MESLESRAMLSITPLQNLSVSENTGEKPQSKVFEYAGQWWTVMPHSSGTSVFRLDGTSWTPTQQISTSKGIHADVKVVGDLAHVLLFDKSSSQLATLQYDAVDNRFEPWALQPQLVHVPIASSAETATLEVDSTGRMWVAYDPGSNVEVRYADGLYTGWSAPITVASGIKSDDIATIIAMPNNSIGVLWSNQSSDRFGFRVHLDDAAPNSWLADEVPASQSALSVGGGMADDHVNVAVTSDGTLYAAVKTSYDKSGYAKIALLVRRPNGQWDNLYSVDTSGTRPIVVVNEAAGKLIVAYTQSDSSGNIVYRESPLGNISFGPRQVLISGSNNNVTSTKYTSSDEIVFLAGSSSTARGVLFSFDTGAPASVNQAPTVNAGPNRAVVLGNSAALDGTISDDGLPNGSLTTSWTSVSGPGTVTFANSSAADTSASFSATGTYVLRLTASDGQLTTSDEMTVTVSAPAPVNQAPTVSAGPNRSVELGNSAALDGTISDDGLPNGSLTTSWTSVSGPGTVTFANSSAADTSASFTAAGTYVLRLTASDGQLSASDDVSVTVTAPPVNDPPLASNPPASDPPTNNAQPQEIAFQDGLFPNVSYAGTSDTKIYSKNETTNYGMETTIDVDGSPDIGALLRWDVSAVPVGSIVVSAAIELNITNTSSHDYEVYALERAWDELSATWEQYAAGRSWAGAGAQGPGDISTAVLGQLAAGDNGAYRIALNDAGVAAVQAWVNDPHLNYGIILQDYTASNGIDFSTSESSTAAERPKLVINYEPVPSLVLHGTSAALTVDAGANRTVERNQLLTISGTVTAGGQPADLSLLTIQWSKASGPGTLTFGDAQSADTAVVFSGPGNYVLRLTAGDGLTTAFDELNVTVT